ncbi:MAG TPA: competence/damage-inducible protein A [Actinomycetota bacterium]|nr:competence/damage-inducible protein A [Actinomycetota bacterium]
MRAEIIGIGTEILLGQIANTNAREISERLAEAGIDVLHHQVVGDNVERIAEALRLGISRADVVVATGGLGPTGDDVTRDAVASATGAPLTRRPEIEEFLRQKFRRMNRDMPESNLVQADVPEGARYILPERGTAPGLAMELEDATRLYTIPGVPAEMREMLEGAILPELRDITGPHTLVSRQVRVAGMPEARVGELLDDLFRSSENPTVAYLASAGEVRVRLTASAPTREEALGLIRPLEEKVRARLGDAVFGADEDSLEGAVAEVLVERKLVLACAESLTGGSLGARLTTVPGASAWFAGTAVCYSRAAKRDLLGVPDEVLERAGTVSEECAVAMAAGARRAYRADIGLSTTGVAGPELLEGKPPGTVFVAVVGDGIEEVRGFRAPGDRHQVRRWAEQSALDLLRRQLARGD